MASLPFKNGGSSAQRADPCAIVMVHDVAQEMVLPLGGTDVVEGRAHVDPDVDPCAYDDSPCSPVVSSEAKGRAHGVDKWLQRDTGHVFPKS
jgi:hypothetical protein